MADRGELDAQEAEELFDRLTTTYNPEANGKVERGHGVVKIRHYVRIVR